MRSVMSLLLSLLFAGCVTPPPPVTADYHDYLQHMPASIVVLPPLNETAKVNASEVYLSTITTSLAEKGYYVYPVVVTTELMKENGLPTPGEMHRVSPAKFHEVLGADSVLYVVIKEWTTTYMVLDTSTTVRLQYRLVDTRTGTLLWQQEQAALDSTTQAAGNDALLALTLATLDAVAAVRGNAPERFTAEKANRTVINDANRGLLCGARHPNYTKEQQAKRDEDAKRTVVAAR